MSVYVRKGGNWVETDDVFVRRGTEWREVLAAYVFAINPATGQLDWLPAFDRFQEAPLHVRGVNAGHTGGTLIWDASPRATHYQIRRRTGTSTVVDETYPPPNGPEGGWTEDLSYELTGLAQDTSYRYTVVARRYSNGTPIDSTESAQATLATGHPAINRESTGQVAYVTASRSDTWSTDNGWGQTAGDVVQGYASQSVRNGYGGVSYSTAYAQLAKALNYPDIPAGVLNTADHIELTDAKIDRIYRKAGGAGTPSVEVYAWKAVFSGDPRVGDYASSKGTFAAPLEGAYKDDFIILGPTGVTPRENKVLSWAKQWIKKAPSYTGLLIWRTGGSGNSTSGYNGYAVLRAANTTVSEWRLVLTVRWKFDYPTLKAATWTPGG